VIQAYAQVTTELPLVIVGGAPYAEDYIAQLKSTPDRRVKFLGFVFGEDYRALQQNAYCYVHATEVGGTHPALIEAMGAGNCALTLDTPENREVIGDAGIIYASAAELVEQLRRVLANPGAIGEYRHRAMARVKQLYNWEQITDQYEYLLARLVGIEAPEPPPLRAREVAAGEREPRAYPIATFAEEQPAKVRRTARTLP
jgi:glycosyltransferase involved in cell wall biosynthesis